MFRRLGSLRLQLPKGELVTADPFRPLSLRVYWRKHLGGFSPALDDKRAYRTKLIIAAFVCVIARRADSAADRLVETLEARGGIQHIAKRGVLQSVAGADIADKHKPAMQADAGMAEFDPTRILLGRKIFGENFDLERRGDRPVGVIGLVKRCSKEGEHAIPQERVDEAAM